MKRKVRILASAALLVAFSGNTREAAPEAKETACVWTWCVPLLYWNGSAWLCAAVCKEGEYCCAQRPCCLWEAEGMP